MDYLTIIFGLILVAAISMAILIVYIKRNIENAMVGAIAKIEAVADFLEESDEIEPPEAKAKRFVDLSEDQILLDLKVGGKMRLASMGIAGVKAQLEGAAYMLGYNRGGQAIRKMIVCWRLAFFGALIISALAMAGLVVSVGCLNDSNASVSELDISGSGAMRVQNYGDHYRDDSGVTDGKYVYSMGRTWEGGNETVQKSFVLTSSKGGTLLDRDIEMISGAGNKRIYRTTNIEGDFEAGSETTFTITPAGVESSESTVTLDVANGTAKLDIRVMNLTNHGPATILDLQAVGNFTMRSYYNLSYEEQVKVLEDPLAFCFALDRDNIRDTTVPDSLYFLPPGYEMVDGKIIRSLNIPTIEPSPEISANTTQPETVAPAARKERAAAKSSWGD